MIIFNDCSRFKKFWLQDLFTNELVECSESDFDSVVTAHRMLFRMEYETANVQLFYDIQTGVLVAKRSR